MTDAALEPVTGSALVLAVNENPGIVLLDGNRAEAFFEAVKAEVSAHVPDLTTAKGRAEIKALAFKVTKSKTAIDNAGKVLKEDAQQTVKKVDAARRVIWDKLEALADEVKAPVVEWETREALRIEKAEGIMTGLRANAIVSTTETAADIEARLERVRTAELDPAVLADRIEDATALRQTAEEALQAALARIRQEEADRAELDRLRGAEAEREAEKARKLAAYEAAKVAQREAAEKEAAEKARAEAEAARIAEAEQAARRRAIQEAEAAAEAARQAQQRAHDEALAAEKRRADEAEAAHKAETERAAAREREALAAKRADEAVAQARAADVQHRAEVMGAAKVAIMGCGVGNDAAVAIVRAIAAGEVPAVSIRF